MVKERKNVIEHNKFVEIGKELIKKPNNSLGLSKLNVLSVRDQSTINTHLNYYYSENFIRKSKESRRNYELNWEKIIYEFILFLDRELEEQLNQKNIAYFSKTPFYKDLWEKENRYIIILLREIMIYGNNTILKEVFQEGLEVLKYFDFMNEKLIWYKDIMDKDFNETFSSMDPERLNFVYRNENQELNIFIQFMDSIDRINEPELQTLIEGVINKDIERMSKYTPEEAFEEAEKEKEENKRRKKEEAKKKLKEKRDKYNQNLSDEEIDRRVDNRYMSASEILEVRERELTEKNKENQDN